MSFAYRIALQTMGDVLYGASILQKWTDAENAHFWKEKKSRDIDAQPFIGS